MKQKNFRQNFIFFILGIIFALAILGVNFWLIYPWFWGKGPLNLGSIEVSYVSMARFIRDFSPHLSWGPYWYFGFPFHLFYTPLLPFLEVILNKFAGFELWQAYRVVSGAGFILAPVSLFLFTWYLTKKIIPGILAALGYTFLPSLFYFILPSGEVAGDVINQEVWDPRRLVILARWGEGPHTLSLVFLPLAGLFYLRVLKRKKKSDIFLAAVFLGLTAMTNAVGFYATLLLFLAIFFSEWVKKKKQFVQVLKPSLLTGLLAYGLIAFWYNLSFIGSFFGEGGGVVKNYIYLFPWGYVFLVFGLTGLFYFFRKVVKNQAITVAFVWFLMVFLIVYVYYASAPPELVEQRLELVPQALRLMTDVDMALSVFLAAVVGALLSFLEKKGRILGILGTLGTLGLVAVLLAYGASYLPHAQKAVSGEVDLIKTGEYEIAEWLKEHVDPKKGERVYVAGNYGFYLNYFTDVWQLRGGLFQAMTHYWPEHIYYQVNHGKDKKIALAWLKAANIKYLVVNTTASRELYKEYKYPEKFGNLPVVWEEKGDIIYKVPSVGGPARVVNLGLMKSLIPPQKADDKKSLLAYTDWLDGSAPADFEMVNHDFYKIKAKVGEGEGILVQMTADPGFKARANGRKLKIKKDTLGFMVLVPSQPGEYEVILTHSKTWKIWLGYLMTLGTIAGLFWFSPLGKRLRYDVQSGIVQPVFDKKREI